MQQILDSFNFSREISFLGLMDLTSQQHRRDAMISVLTQFKITILDPGQGYQIDMMVM